MTTTYSHARANLAELWDKVLDEREPLIVTRRGKEPIAIVSADDLASLEETLHLLRSPANAERLLGALEWSRRGSGEPETLDALRSSVGLGE